jgi:hypothetical protein
MENAVIRDPSFRNGEAWRVIWNGLLTSPTFNSHGAAQAYLAMLIRGRRKPEYR